MRTVTMTMMGTFAPSVSSLGRITVAIAAQSHPLAPGVPSQCICPTPRQVEEEEEEEEEEEAEGGLVVGVGKHSSPLPWMTPPYMPGVPP